MALNSRSAIHPKWVSHNRPTAESFFLCSVEIFDNQITESVYNATANTWSSDRNIIWSGDARIQPVNKGSKSVSGMNATTLQEVEVHLPAIGTVDIKPNHQIFVTEAVYSSQLQTLIFTVKDVVNSSNAWGRTLVCVVDQEVRRSV